MQQTKTKRKSLVVAHGRYDIGGWDSKVYQIRRTGVSEWAWHRAGNSPPPDSLPVREVRRRCLADVQSLAERCQAHNAGAKLRPRLGALEELLRKRGVGEIRHDFKLMEQALFALGTSRAAARWLTQPAIEFGGAIPFMQAMHEEGWWRVFHALLRLEYKHLLSAPK